MIAPVDRRKWYVSQEFGSSTPATKAFYDELGLAGHNGRDYACPAGTPLLASIDGVILNHTSSDGNMMVWITNTDLKLMTVVMHCSAFKLSCGDKVKQGDVIAISGNTGRYTTGDHVHFGVYQIDGEGDIINRGNGYGGAVDPIPFLVEKLNEGDLIKNDTDPPVYLIHNNLRWWLFDQDTFKKYMGYPVSKANIKIVDLDTQNYYKWGGIIGKS
jgi:murein DD-endopeptidase MepM/ murein hydrolase activator NlpD